MVSSQLLGVTNAKSSKTFNKRMLLPMVPPDVVPTANEEFDFSDVFGPVPSQTSIGLNIIGCEDSLPDISEDMVYDEPKVISNRSHSLVGPSSLIPDSPRPRKHTLDENVLELVEQPDENEVIFVPQISEKIASVGLEDFDFLKVVGQGAFGKVFQVMKKGTSDIYAMKVARKDKIIEKNHFEYMKAERDILTKIDHPFIVQLRCSFQTKYRLYLVLDFVNGGHLFFQLYNQGLFREDLARINAAEIVSAVSHLHANGIMHRDLKPENILLDADGHVMLTDFGLAKEFEENTRSNSMCGTVEYMAPEIIQGNGHNKSADWWSIGILLFEMLTGKPTQVTGLQSKWINASDMSSDLKKSNWLSFLKHEWKVHGTCTGLSQREYFETGLKLYDRVQVQLKNLVTAGKYINATVLGQQLEARKVGKPATYCKPDVNTGSNLLVELRFIVSLDFNTFLINSYPNCQNNLLYLLPLGRR